VLVGFGERRVLARLGHRGSHLVGARIGRPRVPEATTGDQANAHASALGGREALDLAPERARLGLGALLGVGLDGFVTLGGADRGLDELAEVRHRCHPR
jgi:hypothetical protein